MSSLGVSIRFDDFLFISIFLGFIYLNHTNSSVDFIHIARSVVACEVARFTIVIARRTLARVISAITSISVIVSFSDYVQFY